MPTTRVVVRAASLDRRSMTLPAEEGPHQQFVGGGGSSSEPQHNQHNHQQMEPPVEMVGSHTVPHGRSLLDHLAKELRSGGCASAEHVMDPMDDAMSTARWEALLQQWQPSCETAAARRSRKAWRRKAVDLVLECGGVPPGLRRQVWTTVLEAAVEPQRGADAYVSPRASNQSAPTPAVPHHVTPSGLSRKTIAREAVESKAPDEVLEVDDEKTPTRPRSTTTGDESTLEKAADATPGTARPVSRKPFNEEPRWARSRRSEDGRVSPRTLPREIALDVPRTFGGRDVVADETMAYQNAVNTTSTCVGTRLEDADASRYFEETRLRRLLTHFARVSPGVQYFQGMNFLGGTLLRVFDEPVDPIGTGRGVSDPPPGFTNGSDAFVRPPSTDAAISAASAPAQTALQPRTHHFSAHQQKNQRGRRPSRRGRSQPPLLRTTTVDATTATAFRGLMALVTPLYVPDFLGLRELVVVATALLPKVAPKLASVLETEGLDLMPVLAPWCLTLFASTAMDYDCVLVCWDFLVLGTPSRREELLLSGDGDDHDAAAAEVLVDDAGLGVGGPGAHSNASGRAGISPRVQLRRGMNATPTPDRSVRPSGGASTTRGENPPNSETSVSENATAAPPAPTKARRPSMSFFRKRISRKSRASIDTLANTAANTANTANTLSRNHGDDDDATGGPPPATEVPPAPPRVYETPPPPASRTHLTLPPHSQRSRPLLRQGGKSNLSTTAERHGVLLRLCLVMLRLGEQATWENNEDEPQDDLRALSQLLEAAQPSPVCDPELSPGAAETLQRKRSGCCFPADVAVLCSLFAKTKVDARTVRGLAKRFRKDHAIEFHSVEERRESTPLAAVHSANAVSVGAVTAGPEHHTPTDLHHPRDSNGHTPVTKARPSWARRLFRTVVRPLSNRRKRWRHASTSPDSSGPRQTSTGDPSLQTY